MSKMEDLAAVFGKQEDLDPALARCVEENGPLGVPILKHPLVYSMPMYDPVMNAMLNAQFKAKTEYASEALAAGNYPAYVWIHERPYRLQALLEAGVQGGHGPEFWELAGDVWSDSENIYENLETWRILIAQMKDNAQAYTFMTEEEREEFKALPLRLHVYRGQRQTVPVGISWTLDIERAKWFATRYAKEDACVLEGTTDKRNIAALLTRRGEHEIVVFPEHVKVTYIGREW